MAFFLLISLVFLFGSLATASSATTPYTPTDYFILNCGALSKTSDENKRNWDTDSHSKYTPWNMNAISSAFEASEQDPSVNRVPYMIARIFHSNFTYTFPMVSGPKFIRLYFYPATYSNLNKSGSFFSVRANEYTLLSNFSAFLAVSASEPRKASLVKEFIVNIGDDQRLSITFSPSQNSYAFINGIEIVSMPNKLYYRGNGVQIKFGNQVYYLENDTSLETLYRLNIGGSRISINNDTGMFREWSQDDDYVYGADTSFTPHRDIPMLYTDQTPPYTAPKEVYATCKVMNNYSKGLEWNFTVDSGFYYLLRLHFCEITVDINGQNQRVFNVLINDQIAERQVDVYAWTDGPGVPIFRDYVTWVPTKDLRRGKSGLNLSLFPDKESMPKYMNVLLNGLEIFKLSDSNRSLAAANPDFVPDSPPPGLNTQLNKKNGAPSTLLLVGIIGGAVMGIILLSVTSFLILRRHKQVKESSSNADKSSWLPLFSTPSRSTTKTSSSGSLSLPSDLCRHFLLEEIKSATGNFDANFVIGRGGFGDVYKGYIDNGATVVAIKRLNPSSSQGFREFQTEIEMLSKLRHLHLVGLIGYCDENGEMILVYDYMAHGTLRDHLYNADNPPLSWRKRLQICIGAAKGLHYLHTGAKYPIIHRDVKSTNILLDEKWVAKVSDFGLSKIGPAGGAHTHVSTVVKGSFGYVDPEYYKRQQLTDKSDVYSFGVVLFEVLCSRQAIVPNLPKQQVNLAEWAKHCYRKMTLEQIIDPKLKGEIAPECLSQFAEIGFRCLGNRGADRPAMSDVVWSLEFALQLQDAAESRAGGNAKDAALIPMSPSYPLLLQGEHISAEGDSDDDVFTGSSKGVSRSNTTEDSHSNSDNRMKSETVFSEINNPFGR